MNAFTYSYPTKVCFGEKAAEKHLPAELAKIGPNVLLAYGGGSIKINGIYDELLGILKDAGKTVTEFTGIMPNPTYAKVQDGAALAREKNIDFILAVGGGSVIDCCKIVSAQAKLDRDIWELEYTDHGQPTEFIPMGAVVTAFGTGAEMNNGAVITNNDFTGKTVIPFCTSTSSGLGDSGTNLEKMAGTGNWLEGQRFNENPSEDSVREWARGLVPG